MKKVHVNLSAKLADATRFLRSGVPEPASALPLQISPFAPNSLMGGAMDTVPVGPWRDACRFKAVKPIITRGIA
jgi:hypothetical protein